MIFYEKVCILYYNNKNKCVFLIFVIVYEDEETLIPKNTSLLIARIPSTHSKAKVWEGYGGDSTPPARIDEGGPIAKAVDLANLDASEDDKIRAMMSQSTLDYDPSK